VNLTEYDWIVVSSSAGKDSQAMLDYVCEQARNEGVIDRIVVVHADLGRVEWRGTRELAQKQADHYCVRFEVVKRRQNDLLDHVRQRGMWPSSKARYCTSDHKRGPIRTLFTRLVREFEAINRPCRILNCMGMRASESPARSKRKPFKFDASASNGKREVYEWLPIHQWSEDQVWSRIKKSGVEYHPAYDYGMPRLSCCFCIFAPREALMVAGKHNRELLNEYVEVENEINHTFRKDFRIAEIKASIDSGEVCGAVSDWRM
jgi:3'-phosphoadenosine 5'-phosphosulfate sulfotransferase (PAPS reductase)/FAD synthetase